MVPASMADIRESEETPKIGDLGRQSGLRRAGAMDPWDRPRPTATPFDDRVAR
jgi:hypothetical protein